MFPIIIGAYLFNPFYVGLYQQDKTHVYVTPGTYYWGFPMRILTQHEITKITLVSVWSSLFVGTCIYINSHLISVVQSYIQMAKILKDLLFLCPRDEELGRHINLPLSICPSGYRYMVCPAISSYSFGATALIFCRMFIHIMEVCMSTGFCFSSNILKITGSWT